MCKGYLWRVEYARYDSAGKYSPMPVEWYDTLAEARKAVRGRGPMDRRPDDLGMIARAFPVSDIPPNYGTERARAHYFYPSGRDVRELVW